MPIVLSTGEAIVFALLGSVAVLLLDLVKYERLPPGKRPDIKSPMY
jgi:hypothetical protein